MPAAPALAKALVTFEAEIAAAARVAAGASAEQALRVADAIGPGNASPAFSPFTDGAGALPEADRAAVAKAAAGIAKSVVPRLLPLTKHPSAAVKMRVLHALAGRTDEGVEEAVAGTLGDADEAVVRAALAALSSAGQTGQSGGGSGKRSALPAVTRLFATSPSWPLRVAAATTLGNLARTPGEGRDEAWAALRSAATGDRFAFVREAALRGLQASGAPDAQAVARAAAKSDPDESVRQAAAALGGS
jgi:HEAT repeat protein